jgi:hypothetical protein
VSATPSKISVRVELVPRVVRHLGRFRVEAGAGYGGRAVRIEPDSVRLTASGAEEIMQSIAPQRIRVLAGPSARAGRDRKVALRAVLGGLPADAVVTTQILPESALVVLP